ncbi:GntR family transcriptional regulator [Micromonospora sp. URMC 107]|uniref:GntR family transcriptional regulator n=1 Tax=Micromonospora sp. URMC 107 TaxID=3423418 RepID=UPI003F1B6FDD
MSCLCIESGPCLALGKTSARYLEGVPTPRYGQPRYRAIAEDLMDRIREGTMPPGTFLPTESALTAEFRASRGTVRQAISILRDQGLVSTEHGRGTCVIGYPTALVGSTQISTRVVAADSRLARAFSVEVGTSLFERETIIKAEGVPEKVIREYSTTPRDE